jgi:hypothetical protein
VLPASCGFAIADSKNSCACPPLVRNPAVFAKGHHFDPEKLEIAQAKFKLICQYCLSFNITMGILFAHGSQKGWGLGGLVVITITSIW